MRLAALMLAVYALMSSAASAAPYVICTDNMGTMFSIALGTNTLIVNGNTHPSITILRAPTGFLAQTEDADGQKLAIIYEHAERQALYFMLSPTGNSSGSANCTYGE